MTIGTGTAVPIPTKTQDVAPDIRGPVPNVPIEPPSKPRTIRTQNTDSPETLSDVLAALGAISDNPDTPDAIKLMQIVNTTNTSIDPQSDALLTLVNTHAKKELEELTKQLAAASGTEGDS